MKNGGWPSWLKVLLNVLLVAATVPQSGLVAIAAQQVTTIMPHDFQPVPNPQLPTAERLAQLHKALASSGDPHDVILEIGRIGDATSVPFLIEALVKQGTVPREGLYAAIDTRFHVLDALQSITNHDAGRNAEDWRPWYEKNKGKTQAQWIKDGFVEHGFPASDPPDDAFVTALIQASDPKYQLRYLQINALRILRTVPSETVVRLAKVLSVSKESAARRATVAALERVDSTGRLDVLRDLTKDSDVDVAENALRTLNEALRSTLPAIAAETVWDIPLAKAGVHVLNVLDDHTVVLGVGYGIVDKTRVSGFDLVSHKIIWTYPTTGCRAVKCGSDWRPLVLRLRRPCSSLHFSQRQARVGEAVDLESHPGNDGAVDRCGVGPAVRARRQVRVRRNPRWSDPAVCDGRERISESGAGAAAGVFGHSQRSTSDV